VGYATADDLATYSPNLDHPDDVAGYLRAASGLVGRATRRAVYTVNGSGVPTDATVLAALRDATCEQVTQWTRAGVDPTGTAPASNEGAVKSRTVTSGPRSTAETYADPSPPMSIDYLCPSAVGILADAGLIAGAVFAVHGR
jgi:hypothetical protein